MSEPRPLPRDDEFLRELLWRCLRSERRLDERACLPHQLLEQLAAGAPPLSEVPEVHAHLKDCLHCLNAFARLQSLSASAEAGVRFVGESPFVRGLQVQVSLLAEMDDGRGAPPVLVTGEIGTGKGLVARMIHSLSRRAPRAFVDIGCEQTPAARLRHELFGGDRGPVGDAAMTMAGLFAAADGGTLFLDGVHALSLGLQGRLLTAIAERSVRRARGVAEPMPDVRVIVATHVDLGDAARRGVFRGDLLDRLMVSTVTVPPLRERRDDIVPLARYLAGRFSGHSGTTLRLTPEAEDRLLRYGWPGNISELSRVIERAALGQVHAAIRAEDLDLPVR